MSQKLSWKFSRDGWELKIFDDFHDADDRHADLDQDVHGSLRHGLIPNIISAAYD
jgi:hypothetical protein